MKSQVVHFAIHADDVLRAREFYAAVFGWTAVDFEAEPSTEYCMMRDRYGRELRPLGALQSRKFNVAPETVKGFECTIETDNLETTAEAVIQKGGQIVTPKTAVPGVGWLIKFLDTEGNLVCAMKFDSSAR